MPTFMVRKRSFLSRSQQHLNFSQLTQTHRCHHSLELLQDSSYVGVTLFISFAVDNWRTESPTVASAIKSLQIWHAYKTIW